MTAVDFNRYRVDSSFLSMLEVPADCRGLIWPYLPLKDIFKLFLVSKTFKGMFEETDFQYLAAQLGVPKQDRASIVAIKAALVQADHFHTLHIRSLSLNIPTDSLMGRHFCVNRVLTTKVFDLIKLFPVDTVANRERTDVYYPLLKESRPRARYDDPPTEGVTELDIVQDDELFSALKKVDYDFQRFYKSFPWNLTINDIEEWAMLFRIAALRKGLNITLEDIQKLPFNPMELLTYGYTAKRCLYSVENLRNLFPSDQKEDRLENFTYFAKHSNHREILLGYSKTISRLLQAGVVTLPLLTRVWNRFYLYDLFKFADEVIPLFSGVSSETMTIFSENRFGFDDSFIKALVKNRAIIKTMSSLCGISLDQVLRFRGSQPYYFLDHIESILKLFQEGYITSQDLLVSGNGFPKYAFLRAAEHLAVLTQEWNMEKRLLSSLEPKFLRYFLEHVHELSGRYTSFKAFEDDYMQNFSKVPSTEVKPETQQPAKYQKLE